MADINNSKGPWYFEVIKTQGISTFLLLCLLLGIWRTVVWSADNVVTPLVVRQMEFMNGLAASDAKRQGLIEKYTAGLERTNDLIESQQATLQAISSQQGTLVESIRAEAKKTQAILEVLEAKKP